MLNPSPLEIGIWGWLPWWSFKKCGCAITQDKVIISKHILLCLMRDLIVGILGSISLETSELTSVWGVVRGSLGAKEHKRTIRGMQMHMARNIKVKHVNRILDYGRV